MSYSINAKVNPFYIQDDEEDPWDDDDDEQVNLISGIGSNNNRRYNVPATFSNKVSAKIRQRTSTFGIQGSSQSYKDVHDVHNRNHQHRPALWKYGVILLTVLVVFVLREDQYTSATSGDASLIENKTSGDNERYRIVLLGERHSGADWMEKRLRECFPQMDISTKLQRPGYLFQDDENITRSKDALLLAGGDEKTPPEMKTYPDTVIVHMTLNPYHWLEKMRLSPEYAPDHTATHQELGHVVPLGWEEFLSKPWTMERPPNDLALANETGPVCKMGFHYHEIVSCSGSESGIGDPLYELQREKEGLPFESIMDLRTAKLKNHHGVQDSWPSVKKVLHVSYEKIAPNFKKLLEEIQKIIATDDGDDHNNGVSTLQCNVNVLAPPFDSSSEMTKEFIDYVNKHLDWETEEAVATYIMWSESEVAAKGIRPAAVKATKKENQEETKNVEIPEKSSPPQPSNSLGDASSEQDTLEAAKSTELPPPPMDIEVSDKTEIETLKSNGEDGKKSLDTLKEMNVFPKDSTSDNQDVETTDETEDASNTIEEIEAKGKDKDKCRGKKYRNGLCTKAPTEAPTDTIEEIEAKGKGKCKGKKYSNGLCTKAPTEAPNNQEKEGTKDEKLKPFDTKTKGVGDDNKVSNNNKKNKKSGEVSKKEKETTTQGDVKNAIVESENVSKKEDSNSEQLFPNDNSESENDGTR